MFVCDFCVNDHFLGVIFQHFSCVVDITAVYPFSLDEFIDLCDELAGPFESRFLLTM